MLPDFPQFLKRLFSKSNRINGTAKGRRPVRLQLEQLEDRSVPAADASGIITVVYHGAIVGRDLRAATSAAITLSKTHGSWRFLIDITEASISVASIELFNAKGADAVAALKPNLLESMAKLPDARLLEGNFMTVNHGLGTPRARGTAGAAYLKAFVEDINASGFVARSIERHRVKGLSAVK